MRRKIVLGVLVLISIICLTPEMALADGGEGGSSEGGNATGGTCNSDLFNSCNGYTWQKYKITAETENLPSDGLTLSWTENTSGPVYINYCKKDQVIYNFGFEIKRESLRGYQVATIRNLNGESPRIWANWVYGTQDEFKSDAPDAKGNYINGINGSNLRVNNGNIQDYTESEGYATHNEAFEMFSYMYDYATKPEHADEVIPGVDINKSLMDNWRSTGAFCWDERYSDPDIPLSGFYVRSSVEANKDGTNDIKKADTGIVDDNTERDAAVVNIVAGEKVKISFKHNLYSKVKETEEKTWNMRTEFSSGVTMTGGSHRNTGKTKFTGLSDEYAGGQRLYAADNRPAQFSRNVLLDTYTVTFNSPGYYIFCEKMGFEGIEATVCASVSVSEPEEDDEEDDDEEDDDDDTNPPSPCVGTDCECYGINCPPPPPTTACGWSSPTSYLNSTSTSGTTTVISRVRNLSLTTSSPYRNFQETVYAKPNDNVEWCNAYYPGVQKAASTIVTDRNNHPEPTELVGKTNTLNNHIFSLYSDWTNKFTISSTNVGTNYSYNSGDFGAGDTSARGVSNNAQVKVGQAGQTLSEEITSGFPASVSVRSGVTHTWRCHWETKASKCGKYACGVYIENGRIKIKYCAKSCYVDTCSHSNLYYNNSMSGTASNTSYVKVPYNFKNTATVDIRNSVVYAGETVEIATSKVNVLQRQNDTTQGKYATQVENAQAKLVGYLSSSSSGAEKVDSGSNICATLPVKNGFCNELKSETGKTFNRGANMNGSTEDLGFANLNYNVYDAKAGDYYCVVVAVYPSTSGFDTNMNASGDGKWYVSRPSCRLIAKRPSFQVWGGSVYSARSVATSIAEKNNLSGVPGRGYSISSKVSTTVYGSWVEQAVIANGAVKGLASGAASSGGSLEGSGVNYCNYRVPLSIANWSTMTARMICPNYQQVGEAQLPNAGIDRKALMDYWGVTGANTINKNSINLAMDYVDTVSVQGNRVRYTEPSGGISQVSLVTTTIPKGVTHVMRTSGNIRIDGNIFYENVGYSSQKEIPKLVIYAEGDITIACSVSRIDAIIVAGGKVKTCDSDNVNAPANSRQLKINGVIIADSLVLNRSYGARTGVESDLPAEIINYDTSAIIWGKGMATTTDFDTLTTVYQHEIAPRY